MASSMPSVLTTPMRKMREEQATKGAVSKIPQQKQNAGASPRADTTFNYGHSRSTRYPPRSPCGILPIRSIKYPTRSPCGIQPIRPKVFSPKEPKRKPCAEAGIFPIKPNLKDMTILSGPSAQPRRFIISQLKPPSRRTSAGGQIKKPVSGSQQQLPPPGQRWKALQQKAANSTSTKIADQTFISSPISAVIHKKRKSITYTGNSQSKTKSRIPIPMKHRRVDPREMENLEEEEEDLTNNLARVRGRLQHLKTLMVFRRPPLIAQRQHQSAIRTNSGASSAALDDAPVSTPKGAKPKKRRSRSIGSIPLIKTTKFKTRIPVMVKTGLAIANSKEIEQLEKEERELERQLNRVQETIQSLKAPIIIRRPMKRSLDRETSQLEGATALAPEASTSFLNVRLPLQELAAEDESFKLNHLPPPVTPSADDAFHSDSSQSGSPALRFFSKIEQIIGKADVDIPIAPFSPDLFLDASKAKSPASIYKHLRKRTGTLLATPTKPAESSPSPSNSTVRRSARLMSATPTKPAATSISPSTPSTVRRSARLMGRKKSLLYAAHINSTSKRVQFQLDSLFAPEKVEK